MYYIALYGLLVETNFDLYSFLKLSPPKDSCFNSLQHKMVLSIIEKDFQIPYGIYETEKNTFCYSVPGCCYYIGLNNIKVFYSDFNTFIDTFLNIPFSIYVIVNDLGLLIHSSSVARDGKVFAFSGKKGIGKSSILATLMSKSNYKYEFYSDDALRLDIKNANRCYPSIPIIKKLQNNKYKSLYKNSYGKYFIPVKNGEFTDSYFQSYNLANIYFLRDRSQLLQINKVNDKRLLKLLLCNNINGFQQFPEYLKNICLDRINSMKANLECNIVSFTNNVDFLEHDIDILLL